MSAQNKIAEGRRLPSATDSNADEQPNSISRSSVVAQPAGSKKGVAHALRAIVGTVIGNDAPSCVYGVMVLLARRQ
jgi:hypothetical protein